MGRGAGVGVAVVGAVGGAGALRNCGTCRDGVVVGCGAMKRGGRLGVDEGAVLAGTMKRGVWLGQLATEGRGEGIVYVPVVVGALWLDGGWRAGDDVGGKGYT